jgi:hypothetical protein
MMTIPVVLSMVQLAAAGAAQTQTSQDVQVYVRGYAVSDDGGEKSGVALSTGAVVVGRAATGTFSVRDCGYFAVQTGNGAFEEKSTAGWRVEIKPVRVVGQAVTFRLRWVRGLDNSKGFTPASEDVELTLRPGETRPMDSVPVDPGAKTFDGSPCKARSASLRISVENYPLEEFDRRIIAADIWLVERLPNGAEKSQTQGIRGLPNRAIPFYFDSIVDGKAALDIVGRIVVRPGNPALEVALQTRSRWGETALLDENDGQGATARWLESVIQVKPEEIVEVSLPKLDGAGVFANRVFSIRIRVRRLR